ncbi:MAG: hypothetical protein NTX84_08930 [Nitrospirae bacterium]|nr:hypothetical protein [Nitrospirota bacterium]
MDDDVEPGEAGLLARTTPTLHFGDRVADLASALGEFSPEDCFGLPGEIFNDRLDNDIAKALFSGMPKAIVMHIKSTAGSRDMALRENAWKLLGVIAHIALPERGATWLNLPSAKIKMPDAREANISSLGCVARTVYLQKACRVASRI